MDDKLLSLLRIALWGASADGLEIADGQWGPVLNAASRHSVLGSAVRGMERLPQGMRPSERSMQKLEKAMAHNTMAYGMLEYWISSLVSLLRNHGIEGVLLKGQGLARLYPDPEMRQCGDIDFYVNPRDFDRAIEIIRQAWPDARQWSSTPKHESFKLDVLDFEMHRYAAKLYTPWLNRDLQQWTIEELAPGNPSLRRVAMGGEEVCLPPATFGAFFVFYHAWHHLSLVGLGLRHLCDIAMVLNAYAGEIDQDMLGQKLRRYGLFKPWQAVGCLLVDKIGLPEQKFPFFNPGMRGNAEKLYAKILEGGNFGHYSASAPRSGMDVLRRATRSLADNFAYSPVEAVFRYADRLAYGLKKKLPGRAPLNRQ